MKVKTTYISEDGTEFETLESCKSYEEGKGREAAKKLLEKKLYEAEYEVDNANERLQKMKARKCSGSWIKFNTHDTSMGTVVLNFSYQERRFEKAKAQLKETKASDYMKMFNVYRELYHAKEALKYVHKEYEDWKKYREDWKHKVEKYRKSLEEFR